MTMENEVVAAETDAQIVDDEALSPEIEAEINALQPDADDEETEETEESDGRKNRSKKLVYPVPAEKLTWPFQEGQEPWLFGYKRKVNGEEIEQVGHGKLKEDDFQSEEEFLTWVCEDYLGQRIQKIRDDAENDLQPLLADQAAIRVRVEKAKEICDSLNISNKEERKDMADVLAIASGFDGNPEDIIRALQMLQAAKAAATE